MKNLTELDKLKYWIDVEFTILHIMFGVIMLNITDGWLPTLFFFAYIVIRVLYAIPRLALIASVDKNYLKVPKR